MHNSIDQHLWRRMRVTIAPPGGSSAFEYYLHSVSVAAASHCSLKVNLAFSRQHVPSCFLYLRERCSGICPRPHRMTTRRMATVMMSMLGFRYIDRRTGATTVVSVAAYFPVNANMSQARANETIISPLKLVIRTQNDGTTGHLLR